VSVKGGEKVWVKDLMKEYSPPEGYFGVGAGLLVADGKVIVNVGAKGAGVVAFDVKTGQELWKATDDPPSYSTPTLTDIDGKPHAVVFTRTGIVVLNVADGAVKYSQRHRSRMEASVNAATPLVSDNQIFATAVYGTGAALWAMGKGRLDEVWANDTSLSSQYDTPVKVGDHLFGVHGRQDGPPAALVCVEWKTGAVKWTQKKFGVAHLIAVDGGLLALTEGGEVVRVEASAKGYKETGRAKVLDGLTRAAPALSDGRLFLRSEGKLACVPLK
jgi:outer membrane protein assembly factor BamB